MPLRTMFWADSARGGKLDKSDKGKGIVCSADCDVIKAFTIMEAELVCKVKSFFVALLSRYDYVYPSIDGVWDAMSQTHFD